LLAAARQNGRRSAGPRRAAGKQNSKLNALKHGQRASPENHRQVMRALGEDPEEFDDLKQELMTTYGPGDALWERQVDDLARLYWRRERLERAQEGLMRRALLEVEEWQHRRQQEMAGATFDASQSRAIDIDMTRPADPGVRLRLLLSFLGVIREQVKQRIFKPRQHSELETLYHGNLGWRQARLCFLLYLFERSGRKLSEDEEVDEFLHRQIESDEKAGEPQYKELLRVLDEEIAYVQEEFQYAEKVNEEKAAIERDAALAPVGEAWTTMVRQQAALDRSIDRKVRILLALRKAFAAGNLPGNATNGDNEADMCRTDEAVECPRARHSPERLALSLASGGNASFCGLTQTPTGAGMTRRGEAPPRPYNVATPHAGLTRTDENIKFDERTENVIENKGMLWKTEGAVSNLLENTGDTCTIRESC
jgi:hypothetical protein